MSFLGANQGELVFVALIILMVLLAPKVPKAGEWVGGLFAKAPEGGGPAAREKPGAKPDGDDASARSSREDDA